MSVAVLTAGLPVGRWDPASGLRVGGIAAPAERPLCVLDGFLDNEAELRGELGLSPEVDRERLLLAGWGRWGDRLPSRLRGDFAILAWDGERRRGLLARDQLGIRPLFLQVSGSTLRFAGELRSLLEAMAATPAPDRAGVAHWLAFGRQTDCGTLYAGVDRLRPGELLHFGDGGVRRETYWRPRFVEPLVAADVELDEIVREALTTAVERRLTSGGGTAVTMSGGLDSASVAALAGRRALACSAVFPDHDDADESGLIEELRRELDLEGPIAEVRAGGLLACATEHVELRRVPQRGWGDFWMLPLLRAAGASGAVAALGGDGGDEVFAPRSFLLADELRRGRAAEVLRLVRRLPGAGSHVGRRDEARMIFRVGVLAAMPPLPARGPWRGASGPSWLRRRTAIAARDGEDGEAWKRLDGPRWWAHDAHTVAREIERVGVCDHLRLCAAQAGLDARHPLLDLDLVELCLRLPPRRTLDPRFNRPVLRSAMAGALPDSIRLRPVKARFESLVGSSLAGPDGIAIRRILTAPGAAIGEYVDQRRMVAELYDDTVVADGDPFGWMLKVWRLLNTELWLRSLGSSNPVLEPDLTATDPRVSVRF